MSTLGLAITAAVRGLLKGVGGLLEVFDDNDSVSPLLVALSPKRNLNYVLLKLLL